MKKLILSMAILLIITAVIFGGYTFNNYLKNESLSIYKTGTDKKAIFKSTWNMSYQEIERANKIKLKKGIVFTHFESGLNKLLDQTRVTGKMVDDVNLWTFDSELHYDFFDNRLFRYSLIGQVFDTKKFDAAAVNNLQKKYGKFLKDTAAMGGTFLKDSVSVEYRQFDIENDKNEIEHRFLIKVTYLPIFNEIVRKSEKDQNSIFN